MKILLSAYACEPGKGSEPGVGWRWAIELARAGHEVWVLTRANNQESIEAALPAQGALPLTFTYYDLPPWVRRLKKLPAGIYPYYVLWQWGVVGVARNLALRVDFDWVHHITFGAFRYPTFLGRLQRPLVLGPIGGAEKAPRPLWRTYPYRGMVQEMCRDLANAIVRREPISRRIFAQATVILCKTNDTLRAVPEPFSSKCRQQLEIGIDTETTPALRADPSGQGDITRAPRVLWVGRLIYWKGLHLGLRAFAQLLEERPAARLTIIGDGPDRRWLRRTSRALGIEDAVDWLGWMPRQALLPLYANHDVFLFPSFHDSSGNVVLEALSQGLPVVCLDLGGPPMLVNDDCGRVVGTQRRTRDDIVAALSLALRNVTESAATHSALSRGAFAQARAFAWSDLVDRVYSRLPSDTGSRPERSDPGSRRLL